MFSSFRSMINSDTIVSAALLIAMLICVQADAACRNIVASSRNAEYMVLDPVTLDTLRVGDLRWLGIHSGSIAAGSRLDRAVVLTDAFLRTASEEAVFELVNYSEHFPPSFSPAILYLENLGEGLRTQEDTPVREIELGLRRNYSVQWADWIEENTLIREIYDHDQHYRVGYELLDTEFNVLMRWEPRVYFHLQLPSCMVEDSIIFSGRGAEIHVFDGQRGAISKLEGLSEENFRFGTYHTKNCKALFSRDTPENNHVTEHKVVDIASGTEGAEFVTSRGHAKILFEDRNLLLQQEREVSIGYTSTGVRFTESITPTRRFNLIDTMTGEVLLERTLEIGSGVLSREMLCDEETPLALVKDADVFYLIEPNTLEIVASKAVPKLWNGVYDVFE